MKYLKSFGLLVLRICIGAMLIHHGYEKLENIPNFANAFVNDRPFVTSNIIGATTMDQLKENIDSIDVTLSNDILKEIEDIHLYDPNPCV